MLTHYTGSFGGNLEIMSELMKTQPLGETVAWYSSPPIHHWLATAEREGSSVTPVIVDVETLLCSCHHDHRYWKDEWGAKRLAALVSLLPNLRELKIKGDACGFSFSGDPRIPDEINKCLQERRRRERQEAMRAREQEANIALAREMRKFQETSDPTMGMPELEERLRRILFSHLDFGSVDLRDALIF